MTVRVTDHALLRWLERVEQLDLDKLRADLARSVEVGVKWGASAVIVSGGKLVLRNGVAVTTVRRDGVRHDLAGALQIEINDDVAVRRRTRRRRPR